MYLRNTENPMMTSECQVFDAARISEGPVARIALPARISSGTHACWAPSCAIVSLAPLG